MKSRGPLFKDLTRRVRPRIRFSPVMLLAVCGLCLSHSADAPSGTKPKTAKHKTAKGTAADDGKTDGAASANSGLKAFGQMIPLGKRSRGVRIPAFEKGQPSSLIIADAMTRVDDNRLFAEKMVIEVYAEKKEEDMRIDMKTGTYNMDHLILSSTERSRVSRSDFQIEGDGMVFDTKTSQGKMVGNVEMIIFDSKTATQKMGIQTGSKTAPKGETTPNQETTGKPEEKK